jgi:hypothetical protein
MDEEQANFNTRTILKFLIFVHFYMFFSTHIDQEGIVVKCIENTYDSIDFSLD